MEKAFSIFPTTHWTTMLAPISQRTEQSTAALNRLFEVYRPAIVTFVRTLVRHPQQAEDIAQDFIARLLARGDLESVDRAKGQFRAYLITCIKNYVISHYAAQDAQKRQALNQAIPIDEMPAEPRHSDDAEKEFTRQWWRATIDEAVRRLRAEWEAVGKKELFDDLEPLLWSSQDAPSVKEIAARHQTTPNAISLRKMRLLTRFRESLLAVVGETVDSPSDVHEEIRQLLQDP